MRNFWTYISNEHYSIGCTGQTVYLYDKDGNYFINIERQQDELLSAISFYNTSDFSLAERISMDDTIMLDGIEYDPTSATYYVLGYKRGSDRNDHFVAVLKDFSLQDPIRLSEAEYEFYHGYMGLALRGFTEKAYAWSHGFDLPLEKLRFSGHSLAKIYAYYHR